MIRAVEVHGCCPVYPCPQPPTILRNAQFRQYDEIHGMYSRHLNDPTQKALRTIAEKEGQAGGDRPRGSKGVFLGWEGVPSVSASHIAVLRQQQPKTFLSKVSVHEGLFLL